MATPSAKKMKSLVNQGKAIPAPNQDRPGRFQIENSSDLDNAIRAVGRVRPNNDAARAKVRRFIIRRAKALGQSGKIPDNWDSSGNLKN